MTIKEKLSAVLGFPITNFASDLQKRDIQGKVDFRTILKILIVLLHHLEEQEKELADIRFKAKIVV